MTLLSMIADPASDYMRQHRNLLTSFKICWLRLETADYDENLLTMTRNCWQQLEVTDCAEFH